jgi:hypothetical protein
MVGNRPAPIMVSIQVVDRADLGGGHLRQQISSCPTIADARSSARASFALFLRHFISRTFG